MQLEFTWRDADTLRGELETHVGRPVHLTVTDNTSSMLTVKRAPNSDLVRVRLHHMFLSASPQVVRALGTWIRSPRSRKSGDLVNAFIRENTHRVRHRSPGEVRPVTRGRRHDLAPLLDELNATEYDNAVTASITWGRMPPPRRRRSIRFGTYSPAENMIRIHPLLDQDFVPRYFVRYIVFHEMLHAFLGIEESATGRRRYHTAAFRRREEAFPDFGRAVAWQDAAKNLERLLGRRRR